MKKDAKKLLFLSILTALGISACGGESSTSEVISGNSEDSSPIVESSFEPISSEELSSEITSTSNIFNDSFVPRKRQEMPTAQIVDDDQDYGDPSSWQGDAYSYLDLGYVYLQDVIDDKVYDWGHSVLKEENGYKMWWVRPGSYDSIYYAESTDLKNWTNVQRVICLAPNPTHKTNYKNLKGMLGTPSVVKVGGTYYMYFEAPASEDPDFTQTILEWDNQVLMATSTDGINWDFYCDDKGEPIAIIKVPEGTLGDFNNKNYGVGQPSAFYKDGVFYVTYCYVMYDSAYESKNGIYVATSTDGFNFGNQSNHQLIAKGNGWGISYNSKINKYVGVNGVIYENDTLDFTEAKGNKIHEIDETTYQTGFWDFIRNEQGCIDTETMYTIHLMGDKSLTTDWRANHTTWDGYIHAVNPKEYANRPITLPNGAKATDANVREYRNRNNSYTRPEATAKYVNEDEITFDGLFDDAYSNSTLIEITRPVYNWGSDLTSSWAQAYLAYNETYLYMFARVYDETPDTSYKLTDATLCYQHDGLDMFVDVPNDHGSSHEFPYGYEQYMICTDSDNQNFVIKGSGEADITSEFTRPKHRVRKYDNYYDIELQIQWYEFVEDYILDNFEDDGLTIGIDFQINDAKGHGVGREAMVSWSDNSGNSFQFTENMGDVYLAPKK